MKNERSRTVNVYILMALIFFQGISGVGGGLFLVLDPTGKTLQIPLDLLKDSPFNNFFIPGLILFLVLGVYPLFVLYGFWRKKRWSWFGTLIVGLALIIWISVEIIMIGYQPRPPLQLIYGLVGLIILVLILLPSVREYYQM